MSEDSNAVLSDPDYAKQAMEVYQQNWNNQKPVLDRELLERRNSLATHFDQVADIPVGAVEGVANAGLSTADLVSRALGGDGVKTISGLDSATHNTFLGDMSRSVAEFATAYALPGGVAGKIGKAYELGKGAKLALSLGAGAVADFTGFDGEGGRLSDLIQRYPVLSNPVTKFLSSKPDDTWAEKRLKGALEGIGLGTISHMLLSRLKVERAVTHGDTTAAQEAAGELEQLAKSQPAFMEGTDTGPLTPSSTERGTLQDSNRLSNGGIQPQGTPLPEVPPTEDLRAPADQPFSTPDSGQNVKTFSGESLNPDLYKSKGEVLSPVTGEPVPNRDFTTLGSENHGLCY